MFLATAVPVIVLSIAIQAVPPVGNYLAGLFGHNSLLEELWTGLLATVVGAAGATLRWKGSITQRHGEAMKPQDQPEAKKSEEEGADAH